VTKSGTLGRSLAAALGMLAFAATPDRAIADDAARISYLESEIRLLRTRLDEQNRRIQRLEEQLNRMSGGATPPPQPRKRINEMRTDRPAAAGNLPWQSQAAWGRVAKGMTEEEVTAILGEATQAESFDAYRTLFYRGVTAGGAEIDGHVNFKDGRVVAVSAPEFQGP
jgi:hypothetical protein